VQQYLSQGAAHGMEQAPWCTQRQAHSMAHGSHTWGADVPVRSAHWRRRGPSRRCAHE
jgi:hypothetical protein